MAQTSGFFDAEELVSGQYDREYVAEQWANYFKLFIGNGVFASPVNQLMVIQGTGMTVTVREGWAFINGYWYHNDSDLELSIPVNETPSSRTDGIFVQWDNADREIEIVVGVGRTTVDRTSPLYELKLAEIVVAPGAVQITTSNITDTRANSAVCGFVTGVVDVIDSTELFAHYQSLFDDFMSNSGEEFEDWFQHMKDQLSTDAAGHLQAEIDEINVKFDRTELTPPTATGSYTYDGTTKNVVWSGLDTTKVEIQGTQSAINAGTYTCTAVLKDSYNYCWTDGTNAPMQVTWTIAKAASPMTLSTNTVRLRANGEVTVLTSDAAGTITTSSNDTSVATASVVNTNQIKIEWQAIGTCTVTVYDSGDANHESGSLNIAVSCIQAHIYGVEWAGSTSSAWTRTDDAALFSDPNPYYSGMSESPSSPFDDLYPWSGMEIVNDTNAGKLVKIPVFWYKWTRSGTSMKLQISDAPSTGFYVSPAHANRGDGAGIRDYVYVGRYHCDASYQSTTGVKPLRNTNRSACRTGIHNLGNTIWQWDYAMFWTIRMLYLVEFASWTAWQTLIGKGGGPGSGGPGATGGSDSMPYHTGTPKTARSTAGFGVQYRYIEGLWDNVCNYVDGVYYSGANVYCIKNPSEFSDSENGVLVGQRVTTESKVISAFTTPTEPGFEYALYPSELTGTDYTTYTGAGYKYTTAQTLWTGANYYGVGVRGFFYYNHGASGTDAASDIGARLMKLP